MRPLLLLAALLLFQLRPALAQQPVAHARQSSSLTKVFRLTDAQARTLYKRGLNAAQPAFFTQVADSFPSDKPSRRTLPLGHYLVAHTEGPQLVYSLRTETDREVVVVDNQVDVSLVVRDSLGRLLPDAQVALALEQERARVARRRLANKARREAEQSAASPGPAAQS